ncbi:NADH-quinone oxidoreductase subunit F [Marinobacterium nitratireducens]|uniref:NADH-quinone oxidoreductase subunit F n=2 Tax=Marinobacterium nitratireducens TaxID=518897 RepID=A0A918DQK3_9GAMM|nr:NADH-quinone oxidoreductase subunit NuoF [Marinobacterium nitratireducens]GGO78156.1 NADH-quinone oxidoreductase subunit F [Marinobacterium nitratireducens]
MERPLTHHLKDDGTALSLAEYRATGGYEALHKALSGMAAEDVLEEVRSANLRGRGGAGFPTGVKWSLVPRGEGAPHPKYLVANADEMEPGAFKDRLLLERNPHLLLEGMLLAAYAIEADVAYIFLRGEYVDPARCLRKALAEARDAGLIGTHILGSDFSLELHLHISAGRYICGEETALINALEGKRATPRAKPPFPQISGAWGRPTVVNNVETLCNVAPIVRHGADWYRSLGLGDESGTKLFGASGRVRRPGIWELPMGTSIREIFEICAGGMQEGYGLRGFLPGGGSTDFLLPQHLDLPMTYESIGQAGSRMGTGTLIVLDDRTCPVGMVLNLERFFAQESCGWCTPCRDGLPWTRQLLEAIEAGQGRPEDLATLEEHCGFMGPGKTFCALAPGAMEPLQSALKFFRDDFERHIAEGRCPYRQA